MAVKFPEQFPLKHDTSQRQRWQAAADVEQRTLSDWIRLALDRAADETASLLGNGSTTAVDEGPRHAAEPLPQADIPPGLDPAPSRDVRPDPKPSRPVATKRGGRR